MKTTALNLFIVLVFFLGSYQLKAQCPGAYSCEQAPILCNPHHLNGLSCLPHDFLLSQFPTSYLCNGLGVPHNLTWWAFAGNGAQFNLTISYNIAQCEILMTGLQAGILYGDCSNLSVLDCFADCSVGGAPIQLGGFLDACETYYLWVDGCNGDVCMFNITTAGPPGSSGTLPRPMPKPFVQGPACVCGEAEVVFPGYAGGSCMSNVSWKVNGIESGTGDRVFVPIPDERPIEVCVKTVLGGGGSICDQDSTCIIIQPDPIPTIRSTKIRNICFEDQPYYWNGLPITSSCVNPPCTSRFVLPFGCCVDSAVSFRILNNNSPGRKEVFICGHPPEISPFVSDDGNRWLSDACGELIEFSHPIYGCDTSHYLDVRYFQYSKDDLTFCPPCGGEFGICPNVRYTPDCLEFDDNQVKIILEWYDQRDSTLLDTLYGTECFVPESMGTYCYNMFAIFKTDTCIIENECITFDSSHMQTLEVQKYLCDSNEVIFIISDTTGLCDVDWQADIGRTRVTGSQSDTLIVTFLGAIPDSVRITAIVESDCIIDTFVDRYNLVEASFTDTMVVCESELPYIWGEDTILAERVVLHRSIFNGCIVDSTRTFEIAPIEIVAEIDTTICVINGDTAFYRDPNGKEWKTNLNNQLIDIGGMHRCDSLAYLNLEYISADNIPVVDTTICFLLGSPFTFEDAYGNVFDQPQDSVLVPTGGAGCNNNYILNLAFVGVGWDWESDCSCHYECVKIDPQLTFTSSGILGSYAWITSMGDTISTDSVLYACQDDVHCLKIQLKDASGRDCGNPLELCEPINEFVFLPEAKLNRLKSTSRPARYIYELNHNGTQTCHLDWYTSFPAEIVIQNPQRTRVEIIPQGKMSGRQEICSVHQFYCGARDTLCQTIYFEERQRDSGIDP